MTSEIVVQRVKEACARVLAGKAQGTGYLLRRDLLVTCAHVVSTVGVGGSVVACFQHPDPASGVVRTEICGAVERIEPREDWALIRLQPPLPTARPLGSGGLPRGGARWVAYGFPQQADGQGMLIEGAVRDPSSHLSGGQPVMQLFSDDAAAGQGPLLHGFSGAPVLVGGRVVGHLRRVLPDASGRAEMGALFACPAVRYLASLPPSLPEGPELLWQAPATDSGYDPLWYVHREGLEKTALNYLSVPGSPIVLVAPEHFGKTVLLDHLLDRVRRSDEGRGQSSDVLRLDLRQSTAAERATFAALIGWVIDRMTEQLAGQIPPSNPGTGRRAAKVPISPQLRLRTFLKEYLQSSPRERAIIVLDAPDLVEERSCAAEFYALLRSLAVDRSPPYTKLRWLLSLSVDPASLDGPQFSQFFGLSQPQVLEPFDRTQTLELAEAFGTPIAEQEPALDALRLLVGGQPRMLRWALYAARQSEMTLQALLEQARSDPQGGVFAQPLRRLYFYLREQGLIQVLCGVLKNPRFDLTPQQYASLYRKGLILMTAAGHYQVSSPLFRQYFQGLCL